ncbi:hypothetical protein [Alteribacillus sp. HJP-4]|uniref:hypothetical protein n=1 Tax=Alteribacillus sp. HJP-4 TaxID=2775394 RepID=UPI0035CCE1DB
MLASFLWREINKNANTNTENSRRVIQMFTVKETKKTKQIELWKDGKAVQKACRDCGRVKLIEDFTRKMEGNYRVECKVCFNVKQREYLEQNRDKRAVERQNYRARILGMPDNFTEEDLQELKRFSNGRCLISGKKVENLEIDHFQALSKRFFGSTKGNIILISREVNQRKGTMSIFEFIESKRSEGLIDKKQLSRTFKYLASANGLSVPQYIQLLKDAEKLAHNARELLR